ncbi:cpn10 [Caudoviricetes sp.]|nr:cpn10 [Caudoviricetes sp.]UOF79104.1 cpn10 [Caudoviricetes sp.]
MIKHFEGDAISISRYFTKFQKLVTEHPGAMELKGDQVLVERLPKPELKTASGLFIPSNVKTHRDTIESDSTEFGLVLMVGPGQYTDDGTTIPCDSKPGDVILLPGTTNWYGSFGHIADYDPYSIGRIRDSMVPMWFGDYKKAFEVLNGQHEKQT